MALTSGTRLGPYEIVAPLGAGGMGEVYRAKDTRLDRTVAIKVLLAHTAADPQFRERFDREAKAVSSLDHPHICTLYDVGHEGDVDFLVMQFLEGETLADRLSRAGRSSSGSGRTQAAPSGPGGAADTDLATAIGAISTMSRGPIPLEVTLRYAAEIADALDAAHRRGIVHRDLKPGNVMLTKSGTKLLDFGLAKLAEQSPVSGFGDMPTRTSPLTGQGALLGTLHYMSPEQLEGREVDTRSDIFAFGSLLFEMLSGHRAFDPMSSSGQSASPATVIAAIVGADPPSLGELADVKTRLPLVAHHALERLLKKCLSKNPDERWQSAADLSDELRWINEERLRAAVAPDAAPMAQGPALPASRMREWIWMGVAAVALISAVSLGVMWYPRPPARPQPISFLVGPPEGEKLGDSPGLLAVSPDGQQLAFITGETVARKLWIRPLGSLSATLISSAAGAWHPAWSPNGKSIAFTTFGAESALKRVDLAGGPALTLAERAVERPAWSTQGVILYTATRADGRIFSVPERGGPSTPVTTLDQSRQEIQHGWPMFLPDGRRFVYFAQSSDRANSALYLASIDSKGDSSARTHLVDAVSMAEYVDGFLLYQRDGTVMAHPFDAEAGRLTGDPMPVLEDVQYNDTNGRAALSVSPTGVLAYRTGSEVNPISNLAWFDATGRETSTVGPTADYYRGSLSPDGKQFVVTQFVNNSTDLYMIDIERGVSTPFATHAASDRNPVWSPDSAMVVFSSDRKTTGSYDLYIKSAGGGSAERLLFESAETKTTAGFSPKGNSLLFVSGARELSRLWMLPITGEPKPVRVFPGSTDVEGGGTFSPDGKWIAYTVFGSANDPNVFVQAFPPNGVKTQISAMGGAYAKWTASGKQIVYVGSDGTYMAVDVSDAGGQLHPSSPKKLFQRRQSYQVRNANFAMDTRGERFLLVVRPDRNDRADVPTPLTVIVNWAQTLIRK